MANNGYDLEMAEATIRDERADFVAFGRPFIAKPDLVGRLVRASLMLIQRPSMAVMNGFTRTTQPRRPLLIGSPCIARQIS